MRSCSGAVVCVALLNMLNRAAKTATGVSGAGSGIVPFPAAIALEDDFGMSAEYCSNKYWHGVRIGISSYAGPRSGSNMSNGLGVAAFYPSGTMPVLIWVRSRASRESQISPKAFCTR
jgi:hypothetical protein